MINDKNNGNKIPNVPNLRFSEFSNNFWNNMKIKDILTICHEREYKSLNIGKVPVLGTGGTITYVNKYLCNWDCVLIGRKGTINKPQYMSEPFWCVDTLFYSKPKENNYPKFQFYLFETIDWNKSNEASGVPSLSASTIENLKVKVPSLNEQIKIATFLTKIDERIESQSKIINKIESLICSLRINIFNKYNWIWNKLDYYVKSGIITLKRGNVIPKHEKSEEFKYPVYSSSIHNNGLMGFNNSYMFDKELITWSVDGGGNFFYRPKHKFNVTNVCGIMEVTNKSFNYRFLTEILLAQHSKLIFDYQTKAHPSVITELYKLPNVDINVQEQIALIFDLYYEKLQKEKDILSLYKKQKAYLLQNMFI